MKWKKVIAAGIIFFLLLPITAMAEDRQNTTDQLIADQLENSGAEKLMETLPDSIREILKTFGINEISPKALLSLQPGDFLGLVFALLKKNLSQPAELFLVVFGCILIAALMNILKSSFHAEGLNRVFSAVSVVAVSGAILTPITECIRSAITAINDFTAFMTTMIPVMVGILSAGGHTAQATTYQMLTFTALEVISWLSGGVLVPFLMVYLALAIVGSVNPELELGSLGDFLKLLATWGLGLASTVFTAIFGVQTFISASADTVGMKAGRFLVGNFVPVVGSAISEALGSIHSCLKLIRTAVGGFGILCAALIFLPSITDVGIWILIAKLSATIADLFRAEGISKLLKAVSSTLSLLGAILLFFAAIAIITTALTMTVGVSG